MLKWLMLIPFILAGYGILYLAYGKEGMALRERQGKKPPFWGVFLLAVVLMFWFMSLFFWDLGGEGDRMLRWLIAIAVPALIALAVVLTRRKTKKELEEDRANEEYAKLLREAGGAAEGGNTERAETQQVESGLYPEDEVEAALGTVRDYFRRNMKGCMLLSIAYAGDAKVEHERERFLEEHRPADELIVVRAGFYVDRSCQTEGLIKNRVYRDANWYLSRVKGGEWNCVYYIL